MRPLIASGLLVVLAVFTKQTALAAGVAIALGLLIEDRRRSVWWILGTGAAGVTAALALNAATSGHYFDDAIRANLNPFSTEKLLQHLQFFVLTSGGVLVVAAVGIRSRIGRLAPLYLYTALALGVWLATAPKTGSDLNYQIEGTLLLALCAACTLDRLHFFEKFIAGDRAWATLLQIPLLLHVVLNAVLITWNVTGRILLEPLKRAETAALRPYLEPRRGPVLSVALDPLLHWRGRMEVEALIYKLLVEGGVADPGPVREDLAARRFATVILYEDVFSRNASWKNAEVPSLPATQLDEIRRNYRLVQHVPGPYLEGDYVYEPRRD